MNSKSFATHGTNLGYKIGLSVALIALAAAIYVFRSASGAFVAPATNLAFDNGTFVIGGMKAFSAAIFTAFAVWACKWFSALGASSVKHYNIISRVVRDCQFVYDLQVADTHEFYANGILVHNCEICGDLDGQVFAFKDKQNPPPEHVNCRCSAVPAFLDDKLNEYVKVRGFKEWAQQRNINQNIYGQTYAMKGQKPPKSPMKEDWDRA